eukprot:gene20380-27151_t
MLLSFVGMQHLKWGHVLLAALVACVLAFASGQSILLPPPLPELTSLRPPPPRVPANIPPRPPAPPLIANTSVTRNSFRMFLNNSFNATVLPVLTYFHEDLVIAVSRAFLMDETAPPTPNGVFLQGDCREDTNQTTKTYSDTSRFPGGTICDFDASFPSILLIASSAVSQWSKANETALFFMFGTHNQWFYKKYNLVTLLKISS